MHYDPQIMNANQVHRPVEFSSVSIHTYQCVRIGSSDPYFRQLGHVLCHHNVLDVSI